MRDGTKEKKISERNKKKCDGAKDEIKHPFSRVSF